MKSKITPKIIFLIGFLVAVIYYFISAKKLPISEISETPYITDEISTYQPVYFQTKEYFKNSEIPLKYFNNWLKLAFYLDKARESLKQPIYIISGYESPVNGLITNLYNICQAVTVTASNITLIESLENIINNLNSKGLSNFTKVQRVSNGIYLEI